MIGLLWLKHQKRSKHRKWQHQKEHRTRENNGAAARSGKKKKKNPRRPKRALAGRSTEHQCDKRHTHTSSLPARTSKLRGGVDHRSQHKEIRKVQVLDSVRESAADRARVETEGHGAIPTALVLAAVDKKSTLRIKHTHARTHAHTHTHTHERTHAHRHHHTRQRGRGRHPTTGPRPRWLRRNSRGRCGR